MSPSTRPRGPKPLLDEGRVIEAGLSLLDSDGLEAVSFRRIAAQLGVSHMTLYSCFPSKAALLEAMVARTIDVPAIHGEELPWDRALTVAVEEMHSALTRRPAIAELLMTQQLDGVWIDGVRESLLDVLRRAGWEEQRARDSISMIFNYLLGSALIDSHRARGGSHEAFGVGLRYLINGLRADAR